MKNQINKRYLIQYILMGLIVVIGSVNLVLFLANPGDPTVITPPAVAQAPVVEFTGLETETVGIRSTLDKLQNDFMTLSGKVDTSLDSPADEYESIMTEIVSLKQSVQTIIRQNQQILDKLDNLPVPQVVTIENGEVPLSAPTTAPIVAAVNNVEPVGNGMINVGDTVTVQVRADKFSDVFGYQFKLYYDDSQLTYTKSIRSHVSDISMIFAKPFDGYLFAGATMIGDVPGYSANDVTVCDVIFTAEKEMSPDEVTIQLQNVDIVPGAGGFVTDVPNWVWSLK